LVCGSSSWFILPAVCAFTCGYRFLPYTVGFCHTTRACCGLPAGLVPTHTLVAVYCTFIHQVRGWFVYTRCLPFLVAFCPRRVLTAVYLTAPLPGLPTTTGSPAACRCCGCCGCRALRFAYARLLPDIRGLLVAAARRFRYRGLPCVAFGLPDARVRCGCRRTLRIRLVSSVLGSWLPYHVLVCYARLPLVRIQFYRSYDTAHYARGSRVRLRTTVAGFYYRFPFVGYARLHLSPAGSPATACRFTAFTHLYYHCAALVLRFTSYAHTCRCCPAHARRTHLPGPRARVAMVACLLVCQFAVRGFAFWLPYRGSAVTVATLPHAHWLFCHTAACHGWFAVAFYAPYLPVLAVTGYWLRFTHGLLPYMPGYWLLPCRLHSSRGLDCGYRRCWFSRRALDGSTGLRLTGSRFIFLPARTHARLLRFGFGCHAARSHGCLIPRVHYLPVGLVAARLRIAFWLPRGYGLPARSVHPPLRYTVRCPVGCHGLVCAHPPTLPHGCVYTRCRCACGYYHALPLLHRAFAV